MKIRDQRASDMEIALFWAEHIDNPCTVEVEGEIKNIRYFYLREAERIMSNLKNPFARDFLRLKINEYA